MAGEWIPYDICLPQKPEVLELVEATGLPVDQVVGRLMMLWGWAALNSSDGTARMSVRLLGRICGGDEAFWREVENVGWLVIDADNGTVAIPGWDRRFSKSAKSRALHTIRAEEAKTRTSGCAKAQPKLRRGALERGDRNSSSSPGDAARTEGGGPAGPSGWETLRTAWAEAVKRKHGKAWCLPTAPDKLADRLDEPGWFEKALAAIEALPRCRYFADPVTLPQLVAPGFVDKILGGQFDNPRHARQAGRPGEDPPPAPLSTWSPSELAAFEASKRAIADKIRQGGAA